MNIAKNINTVARDVRLNESCRIENPVNFIDSNFEECVKEIYSSNDHLVIKCIGKSAIFANKIMITLISTGTPSVFICTTDVIHGESGVIQPQENVISISKSGNNPEFKAFVPLLKRSGTKLVAQRTRIMYNQL